MSEDDKRILAQAQEVLVVLATRLELKGKGNARHTDGSGRVTNYSAEKILGIAKALSDLRESEVYE